RSTTGSGGALVPMPPMTPQPARTSAPKLQASAALRRMGLLRVFRGDRALRQAHTEMRARVFAVDDLDRAAMRVDELEHDGQADACALHMSARSDPARVEGVEYARALIGRDADAA